MPPIKKPKKEQKEQKLDKIVDLEKIRNEDSGRITGVRLPSGEIQLGSEIDIRGLIETRAAQSLIPIVEGTQAAAERNVLLKEQRKEELKQKLISEIGQPIQQLQPTQEQPDG